MHRKINFTVVILALSLIIITIEPVFANDNHTELMNFSLITNLNQTVGKDVLNLVDESRLDILNTYMSPHWSPDGTRMLIHVQIIVNTRDKAISSSTLGDVLALYVANGDGTDIKRISWGELTPYIAQKGESKWIGPSTWSHTGDFFLYEERSGRKAGGGGGTQHNLFIVDAKNLNLIAKKSIPIKEGPILEWSPKEDSLLYLGIDEQYKHTVFLFDLIKNVSDELPITKYRTARFGNNDLIWSPDGKKIGFEGDGGLFILDIDTREVNNLFSTDNHISIRPYAFSPDSSKIIVSEIKSTGKPDSVIHDVYVVDVRSGKSNMLTSFEYGYTKEWFPDSDRILYVATSKAGTDSQNDTLCSLPVEGGNTIPLFNFSKAHIIDTYISPSGDYIGVIGGTDCLMNKNGSNKMHLNLNKGGMWHDRDELLLQMINENQDNTLAVMNVSTKEIRQIPLLDPYIDKISWSPTGRYLIARTYKPKISNPIVNSDYKYQHFLIELPEYDRPMRIEIDRSPLIGTDVNISAKSVSGGIDNATILVNGDIIGTTNEQGIIQHRFDEMGELRLRTIKDGYNTANRTINTIDHIDKQQGPSSEDTDTVTSSVPAEYDTGSPGFTVLSALVGLISTVLYFHLISKRK